MNAAAQCVGLHRDPHIPVDDFTGSGPSTTRVGIDAAARIADYHAMNRAWDASIDKKNAPARATGQVPLAREKYRVEIAVTAVSTAAAAPEEPGR